MFGRNEGMKKAVGGKAGSARRAATEVADAVAEYVDPLVKDEKLRERLAAAMVAAIAAQQRLRARTGRSALLRRVAADPVLRAQLLEMGTQLRAAQRRSKRARSHTFRNTILFVSGVGLGVAAVPAARNKVLSLLREFRHAPARLGVDGARQASIEEEIEVAVPVQTAYNQWTQFEEFPRFMEGVDEVRQLDDTLLHWAASVAGKHAEWDAKIIEQDPDRRIAWESTDGKRTRGTVSFEDMGAGRTRIRLHMTYMAEGVSEQMGSAIGLDSRRIQGDLQRFRELVEKRQVETGSWRGTVKDGQKTDGQKTDGQKTTVKPGSKT